MPRRRNSVPSPLNLTSACTPLRRGQPKFVLPAAPTSKAIHISTHHRMKRSDASQVTVLRPLPGLDIPDGVYAMMGPASSSEDTESSAVSLPSSSASSSPASLLSDLTLPPPPSGLMEHETLHLHRQGHHERRDSDQSSVESGDGTLTLSSLSSSSSTTSSSVSSTLQASSPSSLSSSPELWRGSISRRPWTGPNAVLPQIKRW